MTLRQYLAAMIIGAGLAWAAVGVVVFKVSQPEASGLLVIFLYCALFMASLGTFAVGGFLARVALLRKKFQLEVQVAVSFRQALLLAVLVIAALHLSSRDLFSWWTALIMIVVLSGIEAFLISLKMGRKSLKKRQ